MERLQATDALPIFDDNKMIDGSENSAIVQDPLVDAPSLESFMALLTQPSSYANHKDKECFKTLHQAWVEHPEKVLPKEIELTEDQRAHFDRFPKFEYRARDSAVTSVKR